MNTMKHKLMTAPEDPEMSKIAKLAGLEVCYIDQLPSKVLLEILSYIPNLRDAALVNKKFYEAVCEKENKLGMHKVVFDGALDQADTELITESIRKSKRKVSEVELEGVMLTDDTYEVLLTIVVKFGEGIKSFKINRSIVDDSRICAILGLMGNIEEFALTRSRIRARFDFRFDYNLTSLRKLDFSRTYCYEVKVGNGHNFIEELMLMVVRGSPIEELRADSNFLEKFKFEKKKLKTLVGIFKY